MRPNFDDIPALWECDGSLRDIYVQNTGAAHWDRFDRLLSQYKCTYTFDGAALAFPGSRSALMNHAGLHALSIQLEGAVVICCHFFSPGQLELDISPKEITGPFQHDQVLAFVETLAAALELPADLTPENCENNPFLSYVPQTRSWHV